MTRKQTPNDPRAYSRLVFDGVKQTPSRAMLRAVGYVDADFDKPSIGIASTWSNITPCNVHLDGLATAAAAAADAAGGKSRIFNTITVSDGIAMGTPGMRYSLVSREVIADSIETVAGAQGFDGLVAIGGCDKNMPGCLMAIARLNRPAVFVYGGTIRPGAQRRDIVAVFEAVGGHAGGRVSDAQLHEVECTAIPGAGSCGGMYTANTMASAIEALGMSLPNSSAQEAVSATKLDDCRRAGAAAVRLVKAGIRPSDILTRKAFENAITTVIALGGSTNAVLHLLAIAHAARVRLDLDDFTRIGRRVPVLADLKPSGKYLMSELIAIGGIQPLMKRLLGAGLLHGECLTVGGGTLAENAGGGARLPGRPGRRARLRAAAEGRQPPRHPVRQPRARGRGRQDHRQGGAALRGHGAGVRFGGGEPAGDPRRHGARRRRRRDPLRGPEGRARHARDAEPDGRDHGQGPRRSGRADHRWPLLRRQPRLRRRSRGAGGRGRRPAGAGP